jgi:formamidopyrimidine-DNA glycosylase
LPELPEVETVCRALRHALEGRSLVKIQCNRSNLRYPLPTDMEDELKGTLLQVSGVVQNIFSLISIMV